MNLRPFFRSTSRYLKKNMPSLLITGGVISMFGSTVLAIKATPKAKAKIEERKQDLGVEKLPLMETVKTAGPCYIPAVAAGAGGAIAIFAGSKEYSKQLGSAMMLSTVAETALKDYKEAASEVVGKSKAKEIEAKAVEKEVERHPIESYADIPRVGNGVTLCYEPYTARYFYGDPEKIKQAIGKLSKRLYMGTDDCIPFNDYLLEIGLSSATLGNIVGWYSGQRTLVNSEIATDFHYVAVEDSPPIWVLSFVTKPEKDFEML